MAVSVKEYINAIKESIEICKKYRDDAKIKKLYLKSDSEARYFFNQMNNFIEQKSRELQGLLGDSNSTHDYSFLLKNLKEYMETTKTYFEYLLNK